MKPWYADDFITLFHGDARRMEEIAPGSCQTCVTSPPFFGLRDYGTAEWSGGLLDCDHVHNRGVQGKTGQRADRTFTGKSIYRAECGKCGAIRVDSQIGLEESPAAYVAELVKVFREVHRVLADDGTLWLNLGDSFNADGRNGHGTRVGFKQGTNRASATGEDNCRPSDDALKPKDMIGIPWRVAFALQADGWYLRSDIIWTKPNAMPESVTDRPTKSHEYIFLLSKNEKYYYDAEAIAEPSVSTHGSGNGFKRQARLSYLGSDGEARGNDEPWEPTSKRPSAKRGEFNGKTEAMADECRNAFRAVVDERNARSVWTINTKPYPGAHFATFPPELPARCIKAGSRPGDTVCDPFNGSGTTGQVARMLGRKYIGVELNEEYLKMTHDRFAGPLFRLDPADAPK